MNQTKKTNVLKWGDMNFDLSHPQAKDNLGHYYTGMFPNKAGTFASRLRENLSYGNTGMGQTVRVSTNDLRELLNAFEHLDNEARTTHMDRDLRSDPEIVNIPDPIEKERRINEKLNYKKMMF